MKATIVFQKNWDALNMTTQSGDRRYKYIVNEGSSRSSKTFSLIDCCDLYARSLKDKRITVWRDTKTDCKKTVLVDIERHLKATDRYLKGYVFNKTESIFKYASGSTLEIHGTDDEETVHGLTQSVAWLNEPYKISRATFDQIDQRTSDFVFIDWNPKKSHWIDDIKRSPRALLIKSTFLDNPFCPSEMRTKLLSYQPVELCGAVESEKIKIVDAYEYDCTANAAGLSEKEINELLRCIANERERSADKFNWQVYGLGEKAEKPHRIFKHFVEIDLQEYNHISATKIYGSDWGTVDPWGLTECKFYDGTLYVRQLNYESENDIRGRLSTADRAQVSKDEDSGLVKKVFNRFGVDRNSIIVCDNNRPLKIRALRQIGYEYAVAAVKGPDSIVEGINLLQEIGVKFTSCSTDLKNEFENYSWQVDRYGVVLEKPEDFDNHLMDSLRYVAEYLRSEGIIKK